MKNEKADALFHESIKNKEQFWRQQSDAIAWYKKPETMLDGKEFQIPSTIDDEKIITKIQESINQYNITY
ncbi:MULTISPECIES: acetyl-coenzyme A synthetase N-terminal domain-containing protein [Amniculibacterium]|uniref:acetyl-coenzyme A synthetase N-terminal domain-containing protein n=1 Tax=Amniculibacterium TaxID=2715289 RepID=UPI000F5AB506|nr:MULTISPECIES: acetyl-coenzyme A synthetase N-terminal domain-containing protein [Amniculibacterium]